MSVISEINVFDTKIGIFFSCDPSIPNPQGFTEMVFVVLQIVSGIAKTAVGKLTIAFSYFCRHFPPLNSIDMPINRGEYTKRMVYLRPKKGTIFNKGSEVTCAPVLYNSMFRFGERPTRKYKKFYNTTVIESREWVEREYEFRHTVMRFVIHGFHHHVCQNTDFHVPSNGFMCARARVRVRKSEREREREREREKIQVDITTNDKRHKYLNILLQAYCFKLVLIFTLCVK